MRGMVLIFTPVLVRSVLGSLRLSEPMTSTSWFIHRYFKQSYWKYNLFLAAHPPPPPTSPYPLLPAHPLYTQYMILQ